MNKKILLIILAILLVALVGVGIYLALAPDKSSEPGFYIDGEKIETPSIMNIDGEEVSLEVYRYYYMNLYNSAISSDASYFDTADNFKTFKTTVENYVQSYYLNKHLNEEYGVTLTADEEKSVEDYFTQLRAQYATDAEYQAALDAAYCTEDFMKELQRMSALQEKVLTEMFRDDATANALRAKHVLVKFAEYPGADDAENNPDALSEEDWTAKMKAEKLALATDIAARAKSGEDFDALITEYNEDPGMTTYPNGYYFVEGQMVTEFYEGTLALDIDGISDPIETSYGYHIILRLEPEAAEIENSLSDMILSSQTYYEKYATEMEKRAAAMPIIYGADYDKMTVDTIK